MASNRNPEVRYNGSGYADKTAGEAITRADRDLLKLRRLQLMNRLRSVAKEHGFRICGYVNLVEIEGDKGVQ